MPLKVRYGVPMPTDNWNRQGIPEFKQEGVTGVSLNAFPISDLPSGGLSNRISPSEMFMVTSCAPVRMIWKDPKGKVLADVRDASYSFIGRFPWEITTAGMHTCHIQYKGRDMGFVEFEVI